MLMTIIAQATSLVVLKWLELVMGRNAGQILVMVVVLSALLDGINIINDTIAVNICCHKIKNS